MLETIIEPIKQLYNIPALISTVGYAGMAAIIFAETGLMFGFFLPGDSLLITAGLLAASGLLDIFLLNVILLIAAILGDATGYYIGSKMGPRLYAKEDSIFFKKEHLEKAKAFYEKHGGKTIIMARFVPLVRTFAPVIAGAAGMPYSRFALYNITGAILWVTGLTLTGYFLGQAIPDLEDHLHIVIGVVILLSFIPAVLEWWKEHKNS